MVTHKMLQWLYKIALCNNGNSNRYNDSQKDTISVFNKTNYSEGALNILKSFVSVLKVKRELKLF